MNLLAIDTSTEACSASLCIGEEIFTRFEIAPRLHAEIILPMVHELLEEQKLSLHDLDAIAFGRGPGAFTGVRIAAGVVQGLAYSAGLPLIPVSSLATLAQSVAAEHPFICAAFDARMNEIYYGFYQVQDNGCVGLIAEENVIAPEKLTIPADNIYYGIGTGWDSYAELLAQRFKGSLNGFQASVFPSAEHMIPLAKELLEEQQTVSAASAYPVYLRNKVTG